MAEDELRTVADELVKLVKKKGKISVEEAAKALLISPSAVQNLVDFFVEDGLFGIEYKFTTPYIYLSEKKILEEEKKVIREVRKENLKEDFYRKVKERNVPDDRIDGLWDKYLRINLNTIRQTFYERAKEKHVPYEDIGGLWEKYKAVLEGIK